MCGSRHAQAEELFISLASADRGEDFNTDNPTTRHENQQQHKDGPSNAM